jgi:hypothetical protein
VQNFLPQPVVFRVLNDGTYDPPRKVIVCNIEGALMTFSAQVVDPTTWEPSFTETLIAALARRLAPLLRGMDETKIEAADEQFQVAVAAPIQG